jgi:DNA-binding NarL/FixJ family response regulator
MGGAETIRILLAEDHLIARIGLATIVNEQPDMAVVGKAANGRQAVKLYRDLQPDVVLMDLRMPLMTGLEAACAIREDFPHARIVALSIYSGKEDIRRAYLAGVRAYLTKDVQHDELTRTIRTVYAGKTYFPPSIAASLAAQLPQPDLSPRELEVLKLVVEGLTNKQITYSLGIAEHTVKNHLKHILEKLGVNDRTQAATAAIKHGTIHLQE